MRAPVPLGAEALVPVYIEYGANIMGRTPGSIACNRAFGYAPRSSIRTMRVYPMSPMATEMKAMITPTMDSPPRRPLATTRPRSL